MLLLSNPGLTSFAILIQTPFTISYLSSSNVNGVVSSEKGINGAHKPLDG